MIKVQKQEISSSHKHDRRRGRPAGRNRTPLSLEERRARNAQYERERRNETADAMAQLAEAASCDPQIANAELLATVISQLQRKGKRRLSGDINDLKRVNENLESQIAKLQIRLGHDVDIKEIPNDFSDYDIIGKQIECPSESHLQKRENTHRRSRTIRKMSISSIDCGIICKSETDCSDSSSSPSEAVSSQYNLRAKRPKVSEQSDITTSTYLNRIKSESLETHSTTERSPKLHLVNSDQSDAGYENAVIKPNDAALTTVPEHYQYETIDQYTDIMESTLFGTLTEHEMEELKQWLDCNESQFLDTEANRTYETFSHN